MHCITSHFLCNFIEKIMMIGIIMDQGIWSLIGIMLKISMQLKKVSVLGWVTVRFFETELSKYNMKQNYISKRRS